MKKIVISMLLLVLGNIFAETIDEEIERLEKENKLLELKHQQQLLQKELAKNNKSENKIPSLNKDYSKKKLKSGSFLGAETQLGIGYGIAYSVINADFGGGLIFGGQNYFGVKARHGIKVSSYLYGGMRYNFGDAARVVYSFGTDVKYLYDFLERDKYSLGLSVGGGYRLDYCLESFFLGKTNYAGNNGNSLMQGVYFTVGMHYFLKKHHIFEINYRLGSALALINDYEGSRFEIQSHIAMGYAYKF